MSKYKVMASEGSFGANQMQARDNSGKILEAADKKIRGMERARAFEKEQEDLYLRAQKFAQGREEQSRELNFKLETENRGELIDAMKRDFDAQMRVSEAQARQSTQQNDLIGLVPQLAKVFATAQKSHEENKRKAASAAAYEHGLSHITLKNVLGLSENLNLSAFKSTEYVGSLSEAGWSEERIDALYKHQYLTRGDKAWVDNKALLVNSIPNYEIGLNAITADNAGKTADKQIQEVRAYTQDWIANLSIGDRPVSAEMMGTVVNPKVRSIETRFLRELQGTRAKERDLDLVSAKNKSYTTTFATDSVRGVHTLFSNATNKAEERKFLIEWAINSHKSGSIPSKAKFEEILTSKFPRSDGAMVSLRDDYGGTAEVAKAMDYLNSIDRIEASRYSAERATQLRTLNKQDQDLVNERIKANEDFTDADIDEIYSERKEMYGKDYSSPALETAREYTRSAQSLEEIVPKLAKRVEEGAGEQELLDSGVGMSALSQESNGMPSLLQLARRNDAARVNPNFKLASKDIEGQIRSNKYIEAHSSFISKDGLDNEVAHWKRVYNEKYFENINKGATGNEAHLIAKTQTREEIDGYLTSENTRDGFARLRTDATLGKETDKEIKEFGNKVKQLSLKRAPAEEHVKLIGEELMIAVTDAMTTAKPIPAIFIEAAEQMELTPFEYQQYLAPAFPNVDQAEFDASTYQRLMRSIKPEKMPLLRRTYGSSLRPHRAMGGASTAAKRGSYAIPAPAGEQTPEWSAAGAVLKFAEGVYNKGEMYDVKFGGETFDDYSRHPDEVMTSNGLNSAAAGGYQFMPATWKGVSEKLGLLNFGPESQEMAGRELAKGRNVDPDRVYTSFEDFNNNFLIPLAPEWASLPKADGKSYYPGQSAKSAQALWEYYQQALKQFGVN